MEVLLLTFIGMAKAIRTTTGREKGKGKKGAN